VRQAQGDADTKSKLADLKQKDDVYYMVAEVQDRKEAQVYLDNVKNDKRKIVIGLKQNSNYFVTVSGVASSAGLSANTIIKKFNDSFDGRGGGKDTFAQGGTKRGFGIDDLEKIIVEAI